MHCLLVAALALSLLGPSALETQPPSAAEEPNTVSPLDVPPNKFNKIEMERPDRDPGKTICRYETIPDSHFKKRNCARRRDREALETLEHEHLMVKQRGFCGSGELC